jgi:DNA (cytosine-5)-methyltransferase 1
LTSPLVLSLFPGIGLLDRAFEEEGFCVVRGPDLLWGGDVRRFHPPPDRFDGIIGGPPCQKFGGLANFSYRWAHQPEDLVPEFARIVELVRPGWFVMENVPNAPLPIAAGYLNRDVVLDNRWFGEEQARRRRFTFGTADGRSLRPFLNGFAALEMLAFAPTVTSSHGGGRPRMKGRIQQVALEDALRLQGCPPDFYGPRSPFSAAAQKKMVVEGVPLPMGRAIARAVRQAMGYAITGRTESPEAVDAVGQRRDNPI